MSSTKRRIALLLVMMVTTWALVGCLNEPARKPYQDDANNYRNYTAQNDNRNQGNNTGNNQRNVGNGDTTNSSGGQTSSLFSKLDYSFATLTENVKIRSGPDDGTATVGGLKAGDRVKVVGKLNGWYVVNVPGTNKVGCINPKYTELYSAQPATTAPEPTKPIPTTPITYNRPTGTGTAPARPSTTTTRPGTTNTATPTGTGALTAQGSKILELANAERAKVGAKPLKANTDLNKLATMKSQDMVEKNYFSHQSPTYGSPFDMMKTYGISYMYAGENLAINSSAEKAHNAWMNSEGHRKNLLNPDFTELGIGLYPKGDGSYAYTQMFIGK